MEAWQSGRMRRTRNAVGPKGPRGFESSRFRQLGNEVIGSPVFDPEGLRPEWATRARQPFFGEISSRFEFSIKFEPTFLRNARICVLSPCDKRILAWLLNKITSRIGSSQLFPFCSKSLISCPIAITLIMVLYYYECKQQLKNCG